MARPKSSYTQTGIARAAKGLTAAGLMIYGAYLINGGVYLDTSGTIAASAAKGAISSPAGDPEDDPDDVFAKLDAGAEPSS